MKPDASPGQRAPQPLPSSRGRRIGPVAALLLLAPVISEVLSGFTRVSVIFVLIPEIMTWGCGALLIRECVRRWGKGWPSMLLMGLALATAEEWVIQQTSIAPLAGLALHTYGRVWGVNWVYFLWALGYESVWVVVVPVQLTELLFPDRRARCWLRAPGFAVTCSVFALGAFVAWYGWTQRARVKIFHMPPYSPPALYILGAMGAIALLILLARALPCRAPDSQAAPRGAPPPWLVGLTITVLGSPWTAFVLLAFGWLPGIPFPIALLGGLLWCALTLLLIRRWTCSHDWGHAHRFAVVFGGVLACVIGGFATFKVGGASRIDWIGKTAIDAAAVVCLISLWSRRLAHL
jgi:hypothetical protein